MRPNRPSPSTRRTRRTSSSFRRSRTWWPAYSRPTRWTAEPSTIEEAAGASVTGPGVHGTFGAVEKVPGTTAKGDYGDVAIGPTGQVMVVYQYPTGGESSGNIYTALDADGLGSGGFAT